MKPLISRNFSCVHGEEGEDLDCVVCRKHEEAILIDWRTVMASASVRSAVFEEVEGSGSG